MKHPNLIFPILRYSNTSENISMIREPTSSPTSIFAERLKELKKSVFGAEMSGSLHICLSPCNVIFFFPRSKPSEGNSGAVMKVRLTLKIGGTMDREKTERSRRKGALSQSVEELATWSSLYSMSSCWVKILQLCLWVSWELQERETMRWHFLRYQEKPPG